MGSFSFTLACTLSKVKTDNIYIDSTYALRVAYNLGILWKQRGFLTSSGNEIQIGQYVQELLDIIILPAASAIIKIPGHSKLDSLETKGNHLADTNARNDILQGSNSSHASFMVQNDISPNDNLEKQVKEAQQLASEKDKNKTDDPIIIGLIKRKVLVQAKKQLGSTRDSKIPTPDYCTCIKSLVH